MESLHEFSEKAKREFEQNEEAQAEIRKRFSGGFNCSGFCSPLCELAEPIKRFHPITGNEYVEYTCCLRRRCDCD